MASTCDCCGCALGVGIEMGGYFIEDKTADSGCESRGGRAAIADFARFIAIARCHAAH